MPKVLIADDDANIRELVKFSLEDEGYELILAEDGVQAFDLAKKHKPDLAILDVMMPGKVGYQVCEEMRQDPELKGTYVIIMSARGKSRIEMTGKMQGADDILPKPFDPAELVEKVKKGLKL